MSVYRPKKKDGSFRSAIYVYDFWLTPTGKTEPERFQGSTGQKNEARAKRVEDERRELAKLGKLSDLTTVAEGAQRYIEEVAPQAKTKKAKRQQELCMSELIRFYGADTPLVSITQNDIANAAAKRAATPLLVLKRKSQWKRINGRQPRALPEQVAWEERDKLPEPGTVNRQVVEPMRRLLRRAKKQWKIPIDLEQFTWGGRDGVKREEPEERVRELTPSEEARFWKHLTPDYADLCELYIISGRRQSSWLEMTKASYIADFGSFKTRQLKKRKPGLQTVTLTDREREIVEAAIALSPPDCPFVFTARSGRNYDAGKRIPIREEMLRRAVKAACEAANIHDLRPHDFRHTFASRALRKDGNLKKLQESLDHSNIRSTMRYAHVLQDDIVKYRAKVTVARPPSETASKPALRAVPKRRTKVV